MTPQEILKDDKAFNTFLRYLNKIKESRKIKNEDLFFEFLYDIENEMLDLGFDTGTLDEIVKAVR